MCVPKGWYNVWDIVGIQYISVKWMNELEGWLFMEKMVTSAIFWGSF